MATEPILGKTTSVNPQAAKFFEFKEDAIETTFQVTDVGEPGAFNSIGDSVIYTANLFDSNGTLVGTKDISAVVTKQLGNGDLIGSIEETKRCVERIIAEDKIGK